MGIVILIVCVSAGLNLALWGALYRLVDGLPLRLALLLKERRAADEAHALAVLEAAASAKVHAQTLSLRAHDEELAQRHRDAVAAAELRAHVAERRSAGAVSALDAASALVRELRAIVMEVAPKAPPSPPAPVAEASAPGSRESGASGAWLSDRPSNAEGQRTRIGALPSRADLGLPPSPPGR
jgi:hypothetical protein